MARSNVAKDNLGEPFFALSLRVLAFLLRLFTEVVFSSGLT